MEETLWRVAALVAYDGTEFFGFQVQRGQPTVQGALEEAVGTFTTLEGRISGAGRTDTGVHANGQVIAAQVRWRHDLDSLQRAWNAHLPKSIVVRRVIAAADGFHPRFCAVSRTYRYSIVEHSALDLPAAGRSPLTRRFAHYEGSALDIDAMQRAASMLAGTHDFATFGQPPQGESTVRTVLQAEWRYAVSGVLAVGPLTERLLVFEITANAFLQHMVRKVVGSLLRVGRSQWSVSDFSMALAARDGRLCAAPATAAGLVLESVQYAPEWRVDWVGRQVGL
jgi:tRNA pseudouridine38-40 synthase